MYFLIRNIWPSLQLIYFVFLLIFTVRDCCPVLSRVSLLYVTTSYRLVSISSVLSIAEDRIILSITNSENAPSTIHIKEKESLDRGSFRFVGPEGRYFHEHCAVRSSYSAVIYHALTNACALPLSIAPLLTHI